MRRLAAIAGAAVAAFATSAAASEPRECRSTAGGAAPASTAAAAFLTTLTREQRAAAVRTYGKGDAIKWSNLPLTLAPRVGVRLGDLNAGQTAAADALLRTALSSCGIEMLSNIRAADGVLKPQDSRKIGWDPANYFVAFVGEPSADRPWSLKVDGHHLAYNVTFNAPQVSATPLFDGVEPVEFKVGDRSYEPLAAQAGAMRSLATALAAVPAAKLEGEFRDVTRGSTPQGDTNFPTTYPEGAAGRGVGYSALTPNQQVRVREAMERWLELPNGAISKPLMATYAAPAALAQTYVGVAGAPDLGTPGSYVRIDGPRVWIEFIVQPAVADPKKVHYHTIWRDKVADYGGAFAH
jgi:hypothetical protein